jgi:hypothetical protein
MKKCLGCGLSLILGACGPGGGNDASTGPDMAVSRDLSTGADLSAAGDLSASADLSMAADLSTSDLTPPPPQDGGAPATFSGTVLDLTSNGTPVANATVALLGTATMTTTAMDGTFSLQVPTFVPIYIRVTAQNYESIQVAFVVEGAVGGFSLPLIPTAKYNAIGGALNPPLVSDVTKGVVILIFNYQSPGDGGVGGDGGTPAFGATLSAAHGSSFNVVNGVPQYAMTSGDTGALIFPNVVAGTTTISPSPPNGISCAVATVPQNVPPITDWRVDPNVLLFVVHNCQ